MKTKIKFILLLNIAIIVLFGCKVNASSSYFTGKKADYVRKDEYLHGITEEMCRANYWKDKNFIDINKQLMNSTEISTLNKKIVDGSGTMVFDLETLNETFNADERRQALSNVEIPTRALFINGVQINNQEYFSKLITAISETGYTGTQNNKYGVCTNRADMKAWPTNDVIGYSATDNDDEMQSSAMNTNEPFLIRAKCEIDGNTFYWGYSTNCTGWVSGKNVAICETKQEWTDYWKVATNGTNFITVTGSKIILESSGLEDVNLMLGTVLKLVPESEIPSNLAGQATNNYIVYFAGNNAEGKAEKRYAVLNKSLEVHKGYLPLTQNNVLDVAFSCIGDEYGWGGMNGNMDCSLYTRNIYKCFGLELPRNTTWQEKVPEKYVNVSNMSDEEKIQYLSTLPAGSLFYISGHTMVYIGMDKDKNFVVSDLGTVVDEVGDIVIKDVYAVTVNSLDVRRGNGTTWLHNITGVISFMNPIDLNECTIEVEETKNIYDGTEKKPKVDVKYNGKSLYENVNFEISYLNNIEVGTATIEIKGINNFANKITKTFEIEEDPNKQEDNKGENENPGQEGNKPSSPSQGEQSGNGSSNQNNSNQSNNDSPLDAMKESLANLKLPFTGSTDYGYISTPYFWINVLAILVVLAFYLSICLREEIIKNKKNK